MTGKKMREKLKSNQGTSIFFGILFFLIASILSIVMLNGAVTAVKSVQSDRQAEQNYLTCSSAAKLLRKQITDTKVTRKRTVTYSSYDGTKEGETISWVADQEKAPLGDVYLKVWIQNLTDGQTAGDHLTQTLQIRDPSNNMQTVTAVFQIEKDDSGNRWTDQADGKEYGSYDISVNLSVGEGNDVCRMNLELKGSVNGSQQQNGSGTSMTSKVTNVEYTWNAERIRFGSNPDVEGAVQ